ncbi:MAG: beta-lactamase family protein [Lysobacter sp.]|nr:beta-lactamase family protein [Lysobacter sp.]
MTAEMQQLVQFHALQGASLRVNKHGAVLYEQSFGSYDANTRIPIASASKWVAALVIARLVEDGQMTWEDRVGDVFPTAGPDKANITLGQLMSHTSSLSNVEDACLSNAVMTTLAVCADRILQQPLLGAPGTAFAYGGNSMQVAGRMAEVATGKAWDDLFIDEVALPLNLTATDWGFKSTAPGYVRRPNPRIAGGVRSTLGDYGKLVDMVLARGVPNGQQFLPPAAIAEMARDRTAGTVDLFRPLNATGFGYGIGQWIEKLRNTRYPMVSSPGAFGFYPWVDQLSGIAGVFMVQEVLQVLIDDIEDVRALVNIAAAPAPPPCANRAPRVQCATAVRPSSSPRKLDASHRGQ